MDNVRLSDKGGSRGFWSGHRGVWLEHGNDNMLSKWVVAAAHVAMMPTVLEGESAHTVLVVCR